MGFSLFKDERIFLEPLSISQNLFLQQILVISALFKTNVFTVLSKLIFVALIKNQLTFKLRREEPSILQVCGILKPLGKEMLWASGGLYLGQESPRTAPPSPQQQKLLLFLSSGISWPPRLDSL